jgi:flagellin
VKTAGTEKAIGAGAGKKVADNSQELTGDTYGAWAGTVDGGDVFKTDAAGGPFNVTGSTPADAEEHTYAEVTTGDNAFVAGDEYEIVSMGNSNGQTNVAGSDADAILDGTNFGGAKLEIGTKFTVDSTINAENLAKLNALTEGMTFRRASDTLTKDIEAIQGLVNKARVQAGSQYAAIESAVNYTTDLTAQYELGYNTVNDVNFSMETAHLAKNQILQQAATAMLAQANQGQQGLLQLIS